MARALGVKPSQASFGFPLLIAAAGVLAYLNSLWAPFIFDDIPCILENPHIRRLCALSSAMSYPPQLEPLAHRPIVCLSLALNYFWDGLNPPGYHLFNLIIHLLNALVLFGLVRRTLRTQRLRIRYSPQSHRLALAVALIWVVHPLHTQAVVCVIHRSELLVAFFLLLSLYGVVRAAESRHQGFWSTVSVASCALGMASKQIMVMAPFILLLFDRVFLSSSFRETFRRRWMLHAGLASTWLLLGWMVVSSPTLQSAGFGFEFLTFLDNLKTQMGILVYYLRLSLWPHPLVLDYAWPVARGAGDYLPPAALLAALLVGTLWALRRIPEIGFLGAWLFLILAPTTFLPIPLEIAAEHRMYLPLAGIVAGMVVGAYEGLAALIPHHGGADRPRALVGPLLVWGIVGLLGWMTVQRIQDYRSEVSIWADTASKRPDNPTAHYNLGVALLKEGRFGETVQAFSHVLQLNPTRRIDYNLEEARIHAYMGIGLAKQGKLEEAINQFTQSLRLDPRDVQTLINLGAALGQLGRYEEAVRYFGEALRLNPDDPTAHYNLGVVLEKLGRREKAE